MSRDQLVQMARRTIAHTRNATVPLAPDVMRIPASNYHDPDRWRLEIDRIFRRLPLVLGFSAELREPNSYKAMDAMGTPVLLVRGADGVVRSFVNMCSHRGAQVVEPGIGTSRRFACPYHAWTYDTAGALVGVLDREAFGEIDPSCHGLTPLPVAERAGIVFGGIVPGAQLDIDTFLCGYGEMLEHLDFANCTVAGRQEVEGANWKVAYDGYLDLYHLPILHKNTFGPDLANTSIDDAWGPHQRTTQPDPRHLALAELAEDEWPISKLVGGVWTIFPHVSIAGFDVGGKLYVISQLFPGPTPSTSVTVQTHLTAGPPPDEARMALIDKHMDLLLRVVRDEDYATGKRIQQALQTGAKTELMFGRNEGACQRFHRWVEQLVGASSPDDTEALFRAAETFRSP